ncbi:MAG: LysR family transcriptional regulator [Bradyrhizobiaceae bacterium]|nr:LysR family transcriptional regulator [Bradyrhizobiaceae bacterium]
MGGYSVREWHRRSQSHRRFRGDLASPEISRAATELGAAQPAVSNALRRLRAEMDDALFVRSGQTMLPTPLAERIAPY